MTATWGHAGGIPRVAKVELGNTTSVDAFARLRVSNPIGLFDSQLQYDEFNILWEGQTSGSGTITHLPTQSAVELQVVTNNDLVIRQTRFYLRYQPGKSQLILTTGIFGEPQTDVRKRVGYFDVENGIFFEQVGSNLFVVLRSSTSGSAVDTRVAQADWNVDIFDGSGPSNITLNMRTSQIFFFDLEWLGAGRVRAGFAIDGMISTGHEFLNANELANVYMTTANLPMRYEIEGIGESAAQSDLIQICTSITSEGGFESQRGIPFTASNGITLIGVTTRRPILSIRPRALFNNIVNRGLIIVKAVSIFADSQDTFFEIIWGGTLTNASFSDVNTNNSIVEFDVAATAISDGLVIDSGYIAASMAQQKAGENLISVFSLPLTLDINGNHPTSPLTDNISIAATSVPGGSTNTGGVIKWQELR